MYKCYKQISVVGKKKNKPVLKFSATYNQKGESGGCGAVKQRGEGLLEQQKLFLTSLFTTEMGQEPQGCCYSNKSQPKRPPLLGT